jgi:predicted transcriptional regulator
MLAGHGNRPFGPLEQQVLEALWREGRPATVRDLHPVFDGVAYTTLMTTLDRLYKKGVLHRSMTRRAYAYEARWTRDEMESRFAAHAFEGLLRATRRAATLEPLLSCFVDAVSERDQLLLTELERLVAAKRKKLGREESR